MPRLAASALSLLVAVTLLSGCLAGKETRHGADELENAIGDPAGTVSVDVRTGVSGVSDDYVEVVIGLSADVTADQLSRIVVDLPGMEDETGLGATDVRLRFEKAGSDSLTVSWDELDQSAVTAAAARWLAVTARVEGTLTADLSTTGPLAWALDLGKAGSSRVASVFRTLRGDPALSDPADSWAAVATDGDLSLTLSGDTLPSADQLAAWQRMVGAGSQLPDGWRVRDVGIDYLMDRTIGDLTIIAPHGVTNKNLSPQRYGNDLWPTFRAQLRTMHEVVGPWTYVVSWASTEIPEMTSIMLALLSDKEPSRNGDNSTRWSLAAQEYVDGL